MSITQIQVTTLGEFVDHVTPVDPDPVTGRHRDTGVYHGALDARAPLLTSLDRLGGVTPPHSKMELEEHILRNFIRYSRPYLRSEPANDWELLVSAQHHGVPTRLLDWTYSPLVATFFATRPPRSNTPATHTTPEASDRAIWRLDWQGLHEAFDFPRLALLIGDLKGLACHDGDCTPWHLFALDTTTRPFACMLEPPSLDDRIVAQAAVFTLCSSKTQSFDAFLESHGLGRLLTKFVIPNDQVARIRDQLDIVGIDERRLFPDLDGVAAALRRYYA